VYRTKDDLATGWPQEEPQPSLDLVRELAPHHGRILDVSGGSSVLGGRFGFSVTMLDVSVSAINRAERRIDEITTQMRWIAGNVTDVRELGVFDVWHDRAAFHFLTEDDDRRKYLDLALRSVPPGGHLIIGTFGVTGPDKCSGLPVERYDQSKLAAALGDEFEFVKSVEHTHTTRGVHRRRFFRRDAAKHRRPETKSPRRYSGGVLFPFRVLGLRQSGGFARHVEGLAQHHRGSGRSGEGSG